MAADPLFVDEDGHPLRFYMAMGAEKTKIRPLIEENGGILLAKQPMRDDDVYYWLAHPSTTLPLDPKVAVYDVGYIKSCISHQTLLDIEDGFKLTMSKSSSKGKSTSQKLGRSRYTVADDIEIAYYISKYGSGSKVYAMMAERGVAYGRSASSLQTRYSGTIKKNLKAKTLVIPKNYTPPSRREVIDGDGSRFKGSEEIDQASHPAASVEVDAVDAVENDDADDAVDSNTEDVDELEDVDSKETESQRAEEEALAAYKKAEAIDDFDLQMIAQSQSHSVSTDEGNESERQIGSPVRGRGRSSSKVTTPSKSQKKAFPLSKSPKKVKTRENPSSQEIEASSMSVSRKRSSSKKHSSCPTETPLAKRTRSSGAAPSAACATENSMVIADKGDCRVYGPYDFFEDVDALWDIVQALSNEISVLPMDVLRIIRAFSGDLTLAANYLKADPEMWEKSHWSNGWQKPWNHKDDAKLYTADEADFADLEIRYGLDDMERRMHFLDY